MGTRTLTSWSLFALLSGTLHAQADVDLSIQNVDLLAGKLEIVMNNSQAVTHFTMRMTGLEPSQGTGGSAASAGFSIQVDPAAGSMQSMSFAPTSIPAGNGLLMVVDIQCLPDGCDPGDVVCLDNFNFRGPSGNPLQVALTSCVSVFDNGASFYCTAKVNSKGCLPTMGAMGDASASAAMPFELTATQVISNKASILFYGVGGEAAIPFQGGLLCVQPPIRRTPVQNSGGNPPPEDCSGSLSFDMNAHIQSGVDPNLIPGVDVHAQYWFRDPQAASTTGLTDGATFTVGV